MFRVVPLSLALLVLSACAQLQAQQTPAPSSPEDAVTRTIQLLEEERWEEAAAMADPFATEQLLLQARCEIYNQRRMIESSREDPARAAQIEMMFGPVAQRRYLVDTFGVESLEELEALTPDQALVRFISLEEVRSQRFQDELMLSIAAMTALPQMSASQDSILEALSADRPPEPAPEVIGHVIRGDTAYVVMVPGNPAYPPEVERVFQTNVGWRLSLSGPVFEARVRSYDILCPEVGGPSF